MRLFVAVVPPAPAIDHLSRVVAGARGAALGLAWIPTERWHLTLAFYGEVAERDVARVERRGVRATRRAAALELRLAGAGQFGDRVLWVGVEGDLGGLRALADALATDGRPYRPHLTIARSRRGGARPGLPEGAGGSADRAAGLGSADRAAGGSADRGGGSADRGGELRAAAETLAPYAGPVWWAGEVVLFRSHLGPKPRHEPIAGWPLP